MRTLKEFAKDSATAKGARKRRIPAPKVAKAKRLRKSEVEVAEDEIIAGGMEEYCSVLQF
jgi:hypothetical protein